MIFNPMTFNPLFPLLNKSNTYGYTLNNFKNDGSGKHEPSLAEVFASNHKSSYKLNCYKIVRVIYIENCCKKCFCSDDDFLVFYYTNWHCGAKFGYSLFEQCWTQKRSK